MSETLITLPLSKLQRSEDNVRRTSNHHDIEELAASIAALGVLQNLTVRPVQSGQRKGAEKFEVLAGGRRLAALKLLLKRKRIPKSYPVPCRVLEGDGGIEVSLAENVIRTPLHPADQFEAFSKLQAQGMGIEDIAARFGTSAKIVAQRLKLAAVSPRLMAVYRAGELSLDQLVAFTITDDHEAQERLWFDTSMVDRHPAALRRALTRSLVEGSDRRARFVGAEAYEAAGGTIIRDLFCSDDDGYFTDSQLLDRLVEEKFAQDVEKQKAEGWSWVEVQPELDYGHLAHFRRLPPAEVGLSDVEEAHAKELAERHDALVEGLEEEPSDDAEAECDRILAELDALSEKREQWSIEEKARAGVILSLGSHGQIILTRGILKPEERATAVQESSSEAPAGSSQAKPAGAAKGVETLSERLLEDLSAHRTAALREVLAGNPDVALTALLHILVLQVFFDFYGAACVDVRLSVVELGPAAEGIGESRAVQAMAARHQSWSERLPEEGGLWAWLAAQDSETRFSLLAYCTALSVNALRRRNDGHVLDRHDQANVLAASVELDMADWWEPTRSRYLARVSKAQIAAAVAEAVSPQAAENIVSMKKDAMAARAEELLAGKRWLPEPLRVPTSPPDIDA